MLFQRDNAKIHAARAVKIWFENEAVVTVEWPSYSPDLDPVEKIWAVLKHRLNTRHPELVHRGISEEVYDALIQAIIEDGKALSKR